MDSVAKGTLENLAFLRRRHNRRSPFRLTYLLVWNSGCNNAICTDNKCSTLASGKSCQSNDQCSSGATCDNGVCKIALGQSCAFTDVCKGGICIQGKCSPGSAPGSTCNTNIANPCAGGTSCTSSGKCPLSQAGGFCLDNTQCTTGKCLQSTGQCQKSSDFGACGVTTDCVS